MATSNTVFRIAELDFDTIKANLRDYLQSQDQFQDYDFTGSGLNILLDLLAYNTHYMAYYLNMVGNEMFLDSAIMRNSIVSRAKMLGYVPRSARGAQANVTITVTPSDPADGVPTLTLPIYTPFQSEAMDGNNYTFLTADEYTVNRSAANTFVFGPLNLIEGQNVTSTFTVAGNTIFTIPNKNIDTTTLTVTVQNSSVDTFQTVFTLADDLTEVEANSAKFWLELTNDDKYAIYFGDGYIGRPVQNNNLVITNYIVTNADLPNGLSEFTPQYPVYYSGSSSYSNVIVDTITSAVGGSQIEENESIRRNAPIYYTQQNRVVTLGDYSIILDDYPYIRQVIAWGGEDNDPPVYGKVFISLNPMDGYAITERQKADIINNLRDNRGMTTVIPVIKDPEYLYLNLVSTVYYDPKRTTLTPAGIESVVRNRIQTHADANFDGFNGVLRESILHHDIDTSEPSIMNNELITIMQKRFYPTTNTALNYEIVFGNPMHRGSATSRLYTYPTFKYADLNGNLFDSYIEEIPFSFTGLDSISIANPGSGYSYATISITGDGTGASAEATIKNGRIDSIELINRGINYSHANVVISGDGTGAVAIPALSEQYGDLQVVYYKTDGSKITLNDHIGTIDYINGVVNLYNFKPVVINSNERFTAGILTINVETHEQTLIPKRNTILTLDENDSSSVQVTALDGTLVRSR